MENPFEEIINQLAEIKRALSDLQPAAKESAELIDRRELMKRLAISEPTVIRMTKKGKIPEIPIGKNVRYDWPAVVAALKNQN
jgi:predicted DNA-binding transcriptional regulator AlpA